MAGMRQKKTSFTKYREVLLRICEHKIPKMKNPNENTKRTLVVGRGRDTDADVNSKQVVIFSSIESGCKSTS